jgi:hypothetical protein
MIFLCHAFGVGELRKRNAEHVHFAVALCSVFTRAFFTRLNWVDWLLTSMSKFARLLLRMDEPRWVFAAEIPFGSYIRVTPYHDESAGLCETAAPFHRSRRAYYEPLVGLSCSTPIGDGSGPLSQRTRSSWHEQMIVVGYGRISDREKRVTSAISTEHLARRPIRIIAPKRSRPTG